MAGILSYFLPKDKVFYSLFEQASDNLEKIAKNLLQVVHEPDFNKRGVIIKEMEDIEHQNDEITHKIFIELGRNFITPFDREDIHSLASALDDAPQACRDRSSRVGEPSGLRSGPGIPPIRAKKDALRGLSPAFTGALRVPPL